MGGAGEQAGGTVGGSEHAGRRQGGGTAGGSERCGRGGGGQGGGKLWRGRTALGVRLALQSLPADISFRKTSKGFALSLGPTSAALGGWAHPEMHWEKPRKCGGRGGVCPTPGSRALRPLGSRVWEPWGLLPTTPNPVTFTVMGNRDLVTGWVGGALATWAPGQEMLAQRGGDGSRQKRVPPPPRLPLPPLPSPRPGPDRDRDP